MIDMREIKFRAWNDDHYIHMNENPEEYQWHFGECGFGISYYDTTICKISGGELVESEEWIELKNLIFEQFTGLHDNNGKEIYEGDIINWGSHLMYVEWNHEFCQWYASDIDDEYHGPLWTHLRSGELAVIIGNIHESPELLEQ